MHPCLGVEYRVEYIYGVDGTRDRISVLIVIAGSATRLDVQDNCRVYTLYREYSGVDVAVVRCDSGGLPTCAPCRASLGRSSASHNPAVNLLRSDGRSMHSSYAEDARPSDTSPISSCTPQHTHPAQSRLLGRICSVRSFVYHHSPPVLRHKGSP